MTLRIAYGNIHNEEAGVDFVRNANADSAAVLEVARMRQNLNRIGGTRLLTAGEDFEDKRAKNICIVTKSQNRNRGEFSFLVSRESDRLPAAHQRVLLASYYEHPLATRLKRRGVAHFAWHPTPAPEKLTGHDPHAWVVKQYKYGAEAIYHQMCFADEMGYLPILTTDAQIRSSTSRPWTLDQVVDREPLRLEHFSDGIDHIYFHSRLRVANKKVVRLYDHPGFIFDFSV